MSTPVPVQSTAVKKRPGYEEQRRIIVSAAVDLFSAGSGTGSSVSQICKTAGVSRVTAHRLVLPARIGLRGNSSLRYAAKTVGPIRLPHIRNSRTAPVLDSR